MIESIGGRIKEKREEMHMSQENLAKASNVSRQTISALENGKCTDVLVGTLASIAGVLGTTVDNFFCKECPNDSTPMDPLDFLKHRGN